MSRTRALGRLLTASAEAAPDAAAVNVPGGRALTYGELDALSGRLRDRLRAMGVQAGDRVGLRLHKSIDALAAIFGILRAGAAYVPVDAESPAARGAYILNDCAVRVLVTEHALEAEMVTELDALGTAPQRIIINPDEPGVDLAAWLDAADRSASAPVTADADVSEDDVAYILYTSGSTGRPKGVVLSHRNAASFVDWCSDVFEPTFSDVFSSHAPFHFDLSILDIYVAIKHGARLCLIGEALGKDPAKLAAAIAAERISMWYSTPSILSLLANYGKLDRYDYSALRMVFFAGEVFPIPQFRALHAFWSGPRYFNLYGPTETNVCTWYEVPADLSALDAMNTFPIGRICPPNEGMVVDDQDRPVTAGEPGELLVWGSNVMRGYWNLAEQNARAFLTTADGRRWYHTGDIVIEGEGGEYRYLSRRDRMVKRRGYRVELGEIESALSRHPALREVAVVAVPDTDSGVRITAFVSSQAEPPTIIALKSYSSQNLPPYMIPDAFKVVPALPRTSTNKVDLQALRTQAEARA